MHHVLGRNTGAPSSPHYLADLETLEGQADHTSAWTAASFRCWLQTLWFESARRA